MKEVILTKDNLIKKNWEQVQLYGLFGWAKMMWYLTKKMFFTCRLFLGQGIGHTFGPSFNLEGARRHANSKVGMSYIRDCINGDLCKHGFISLFCAPNNKLST